MNLLAVEQALQTAQRASGLDALDTLLHPGCVDLGPDGSVFTKEDGLESYRSGALRITCLGEEALDGKEMPLAE